MKELNKLIVEDFIENKDEDKNDLEIMLKKNLSLFQNMILYQIIF